MKSKGKTKVQISPSIPIYFILCLKFYRLTVSDPKSKKNTIWESLTICLKYYEVNVFLIFLYWGGSDCVDAKINFFQILWNSRCDTLDSFPSHLKKLRSILIFWLEKLNCGFFHSFHSWKNTTKQLFHSVENNYYFI